MPTDTFLVEIPNTRQIDGEPRRRWFTSSTDDLYIWFNESNKMIGFQLCYNKSMNEHSLTWWRSNNRLIHTRVDDGDTFYQQNKRSPILQSDGTVNKDQLISHFTTIASKIPYQLTTQIIALIKLVNQ